MPLKIIRSPDVHVIIYHFIANNVDAASPSKFIKEHLALQNLN